MCFSHELELVWSRKFSEENSVLIFVKSSLNRFTKRNLRCKLHKIVIYHITYPLGVMLTIRDVISALNTCIYNAKRRVAVEGMRCHYNTKYSTVQFTNCNQSKST